MSTSATQANLTEASNSKQALDSIQTEKVAQVYQMVEDYFHYLNVENFQAVAALFRSTGSLCPPFEEGVVGQAAIATYLAREATGMEMLPQQQAVNLLETGEWQCEVRGIVQTALFSVNVAWTFVFSNTVELLTVKVKLLAALKDLLNLK
jgi:hypothetical protein